MHTLLFSQNLMRGELPTQELDNGLFRMAIGVSHQIDRVLVKDPEAGYPTLFQHATGDLGSFYRSGF
jgi:hypothetical protein